ncbi:SPL family radical SAM protein [Paenibacillus xerothermodurans]|uniref:Radical SAM protein n=1 Tax=Paenibacillus xerothermodurans TaxID=1977292 RepID=A0A2W1N5X7_PAEXE|nr:radical SAM protein [Paenibacillus xerothermodurans]PZE19787.1 radical SAM protein [Paenibacillus xerothermodurans]
MKSESKANKTQYEPMKAKTILNPVKAPSMPFDYSINPYRGCQHGCSFCYARSTHEFLGVEADDTFQNRIFMKSEAPEILREQIEKRLRSKKPTSSWGQITIGTATDPYQQIESKAKLTRGCLEVLVEYQLPVSITTRSPLILRDIDLLTQLNSISVNVSISTLSNNVWRQFEPSTPSPAQRLSTVAQLNAEGIRAGVFAAPILPYITDSKSDLDELVAAAAEAHAQFLMPSYLRLSTSAVKVWFFQTLQQHYPELTEKYAKLYASSGYAPSSYREPNMRYIEALLRQHKIGMQKIVPNPQKDMTPAAMQQQPEGPVQLTLF